MSLTLWFRSYFFNPITRSLRRSKNNLSPTGIILITQVSTMLLIGLWHGITWNFIIWGLWHGLGLFIQNRWTDWLKTKGTQIQNRPQMSRILNAAGVFITFNFVSLGWIWFASSTIQQSLHIFKLLFTFSG
ncbi:MAG: hypothetical protein JEZ06_08385 [Anaerolineaceae bacterium]|nr:hypothetical protein [Anaerolineaceae bacterium]